MPKNEVEISLSLQDRMSKPLKNAGTGLDKFKSTVGRTAIGLGVLTVAVAGSVAMAKRFVDAAREQQNSERILGAVVKNTTGDWNEQRDSVLALTAALQNKTNFGDEEQLRVMARVTAITGDVNQAMKVLPVLLDAASVSGQNLSSIANTLTRALTGEVNQARSLGITFDKTATFAERLAIVQATVGGAAEANLDPFTQLANKQGDLNEAIGQLLIGPATKLTNWMIEAADKAIELTDKFSDLKDSFTSFDLGIITADLDGPIEKYGALQIELGRLKDRQDELQGNLPLTLTNPLAIGELILIGGHIGDIEEALEKVQPAALKASGGFVEMAKAASVATTSTITFAKALEEAKKIEVLNAFALQDSIDKLQWNADQRFEVIEAMEAEREEQEKLNKIYLEASQAVFEMGHEISNVISELDDEGRSLAELNRLNKLFAEGNLTGSAAIDTFGQFLGVVTDRLDDQTKATDNLNRAMAKTIALQAQFSGQQISAGLDIPLPETNLASSFAGLAHNAQRAGFTEDSAGNFVGRGGDTFNRETFNQIYQDLLRGGENAGTALIKTIRDMRRIYDFDMGGIVPGAIGAPQMAVVHGGEQVLTPAQQGGTTVNVYVAGSVISNQDLKNIINRTIIDTKRAGGGPR